MGTKKRLSFSEDMPEVSRLGERDGLSLGPPRGNTSARASTLSPWSESARPSTMSTTEEVVAWHAFDHANEVLDWLDSSPTGLAASEAAERLDVYGHNRLTPPEKPGLLKKLWVQINNTIMFVLLGAAVFTGAVKDWAAMGLILLVVVLNVAIAMLQEGKAERAADAIKAMLSPSATVLRAGQQTTVPADTLVPGDVVLVKSGDKVPADMRLLDVTKLQVQEAMLTGESLAVSKNLHPAREEAALGERKCMVYSATTVLTGTGVGVVVATGDNAEIGKINTMIGKVTDVKTNLLIQLEIVGRWLTVMVAIVGVAAFFLAYFRAGETWQSALTSAVAIAVAIIPEGLPAMVTITLAIGTTLMARKNAIIRQLPCVETLGSLSVICSDKTGTLTKNEMTAVTVCTATQHYSITGTGYAPEGKFEGENSAELAAEHKKVVEWVMQGAVLCNDSSVGQKTHESGRVLWVPNGPPTEAALITAAMKAGLDVSQVRAKAKRVSAVPFESEHKFMATVHDENGERVIYVKGAPDRIMPLCATQIMSVHVGENGEESVAVAPFDGQFWSRNQADLSSRGLRVLALCRGTLAPTEDLSALSATALIQRPPFLSMVALVAIWDPPREEAKTAVQVARQAGITVKMITGDHALTALAIGHMLGIQGHDTVITGPEIDGMEDADLQHVVLDCHVYARASPENKLRIVRALQHHREVVAMTGDGVNDAPALKAADVGVAMGITGTDVSKEAAKMVLADDNFASIVEAVREGRRVWDNLRKILVFNLPVNLAQGCAILWGYVFGPLFDSPEAPLTVVQVLYVNMLTSVTIGLMLALEPAEPNVMDRPPRLPGKRLIGKLIVWRVFFVSTLLVVLVLSMFYWSMSGHTLPQRRAEAMSVLVFCQIGYSLTVRYIKKCTIHPRLFRGNPWCFAAILATAVLQMFAVYVPGVNTFLGMAPMDGYQVARTLCCMVAVYVVVEIEKALVDPVLMPLVRPFLILIGQHTPAYLRQSVMEREQAGRMASDHMVHRRRFSKKLPRVGRSKK